MFDHRLGLALGKSISEVHALSYEEWKSWYLFYCIEPWGWWNEETNTARIITMIHNVNAKTAKAPKDFMRDIVKELLESLQVKPDFSELPLEERKKKIMEAVQKDFGIK